MWCCRQILFLNTLHKSSYQSNKRTSEQKANLWFFCCMWPLSCSIACQMLAAIAWLVTEECDKNCFCVNGNWPSVKATTVYLNYLPSNKCSVPSYTRVAQQLGGQTTLFWQAISQQLWAAQSLHCEMLNTLVKIAMQQVRIYKCTVGSLSMGLTMLGNNKTQACWSVAVAIG